MSWIPVPVDSHFPLQNLPYGVFSLAAESLSLAGARRVGAAIGDHVVDLSALHSAGLLDGLGIDRNVFDEPALNCFMALDRAVWRAVRARLRALLADAPPPEGDNRLRHNQALRDCAVIPMDCVRLHLPAAIGDYTDFYSSREHATNVGIMFRGKDNALQPNWLHLPVGYHGRASSVVVSGTDVVRPCGQIQLDRADPSKGSRYGPCNSLDFELEVGFFVGGSSNALGQPLTMAEAEARIFGVVLLNDWSARDIQAWEYVPLGPFTAKNFCTSISPWVVTLDALEEFRCTTSAGPTQSDPTPLPYLQDPDYATSTYNISLEAGFSDLNSCRTVGIDH